MKSFPAILFFLACHGIRRSAKCPRFRQIFILWLRGDVVWLTLGTNENDSMPIGNGDLAANVWTEQNGDLVLLLAKADAWTEAGKLVKLGRVRVRLSPNPFVGGTNFMQTLKLESGCMEVKSGENSAKIWGDANHPVIHVETHLEKPATLQASLETWRATQPVKEIAVPADYARVMAGEAAPRSTPGIIFAGDMDSGSPGAISIRTAITLIC